MAGKLMIPTPSPYHGVLKPRKVIDAPPEPQQIPVSDKFREEWLTLLGKMIEPLFDGFKVEPYKVTCGWPSRNALGFKSKIIGQCFYPKVLEDSTTEGHHEIFISPIIDDSVIVAGTLAHELTHVVAGKGAGHKPAFVAVGRHIGLTHGKPTELGPGEALTERLYRFVERLGGYPHRKIVPVLKKKETEIKEVSLLCPTCDCTVRISPKWLEEAGLPTCGCGGEFEVKPKKARLTAG